MAHLCSFAIFPDTGYKTFAGMFGSSGWDRPRNFRPRAALDSQRRLSRRFGGDEPCGLNGMNLLIDDLAISFPIAFVAPSFQLNVSRITFTKAKIKSIP
ncbi:hypothetical protein NDU88_001775 [Pleurodeles waltl]|uniref:Uncharacterized protein n=1 Tax=Pleurodeles waltl TaxID=8319 RepID=A0AAV7WQE1_PLEWA|nr:hypothetical protein NDU88_001775 [Pleurodeles waltl]